MTEDIYFRTGYFTDFEQFCVDIYFANFGQVRIDPIYFFLLTLDKSQSFYYVWVSYVAKNNPNSPLDKNPKIRRRIWHKLFSMIPSAGIKNWFPHSINRL